MLESSSSALVVLLTALVNPHPNISLISDIFNKDTSYCLPTVQQNILEKFYNKSHNFSLRYTLQKEAKTLNKDVIRKVVTALDCAKKFHISHRQILTVIDYSLPSNKKRLWIFDLDQGKLLYHTYVGHGITSGSLLTSYFSNRNNSKATSMGIYLTEKAYIGREGMSMRLNGIDSKFNNNAANRYIVMHGGWYMDPDFIKQYGRSGRSWGCPALPLTLTSEIINTIKDGTFMVMYYPSERWLQESRFLNCNKPKIKTTKQISESLEPIDVSKATRDSVLFAPLGKEKAIMIINSQEYSEAFNKNPPLDRMLRRRIGQAEYIALSTKELEELISTSNKQEYLHKLQFAIPVIRNHRGYYQTYMEFATIDKVDNVNIYDSNQNNINSQSKFTVKFISGKSMRLSASSDFIRWLGL